MASLTLCR